MKFIFFNLCNSFSFLIVLICASATIQGQSKYHYPDSIAFNFDESFNGVGQLAEKLTQSLDDQKDQARVFFTWVADNIKYDFQKLNNPSPKTSFTVNSQENLQSKIAERRALKIDNTLKKKKGICQDYSELFQALCKSVGIECVIIEGSSRDFRRPFSNAQRNRHAWNAVKIDEQWHLVDATWGAGHSANFEKRFSKQFAPAYFFTPPEHFILNHFPNEAKWQLLRSTKDISEFPKQPLIQYAYEPYRIVNYSITSDQSGNRAKQINLQFTEVPPAFQITNRKQKIINFNQRVEGNNVIFTLPSSAKDIMVFGGRSAQSRMDLLARFDLL